MSAAVIAGMYTNVAYLNKVGVARITVEIPREIWDANRDVLGDPPTFDGAKKYVAITGLTEDAFKRWATSGAQAPGTDDSGPHTDIPGPIPSSTATKGEETADKPRHFRDMPRSQQAAIKCQDPEFQKWLYATNAKAYTHCDPDWNERARCDWALKRSLVISSKKDLDELPDSAADWDKLLTAFEMRAYAR